MFRKIVKGLFLLSSYIGMILLFTAMIHAQSPADVTVSLILGLLIGTIIETGAYLLFTE